MRHAMLFVLLLLVGGNRVAFAQTPSERERPMMAEPIIGESITDIDATEAGEVELSLIGTALGRTADRAVLWGSIIEAEVRANARLGIAAEVGFAGVSSGGPEEPAHAVSARFAASWALLHDFKRDFHLQVVASARFTFLDDERRSNVVAFEPGVAALPYMIALHGAIRRGRFQVRATVGGAFGGPLSVPLVGNVAMLVEGGRNKVRYFYGVELNADGSRLAPFMVLPEASIGGQIGDVPIRVGVVVPLVVGDGFAGGALVRIMLGLGEDEEKEKKEKKENGRRP